MVQCSTIRYSAQPFNRGGRRVHHGPGTAAEQPSITPSSIHCRKRNLPPAIKERITGRLSFLEPCYRSIHSIVVVGSTAYNAHTGSSDIDIVIITTTAGHTQVSEAVIEKEIEDSMSGGQDIHFEYTVLTAEQVQRLFEISSPFAHSIRHGVVVKDDGYVLLLRNRRFPLLPEKEYYTTCLHENIATPYYEMLKKLQKEMRQRGCSPTCRRKNGGCEGLQPAYMFAKLIMRMFYVTLPSRGLVPLTKADVILYAKKAYGLQGENVAEQVVSLLRDKGSSFCFDEFRVLKRFAVRLFREILSIIGFNRDVRDIIVDASRLARGDYHHIENPSMKNCVL